MRVQLRPTLVTDIAAQGFCPQPIHPDFLDARLPHILDGMKRITENTRRHRHFPWRLLPPDLYGKGQEIEYGLRIPEADKPPKYVFHYVLGIEQLLAGALPAYEYGKFLWALRSIATWSHTLAAQVAAKFDEENHGTFPGSLQSRIQRGRVVVRVLRYTQVSDTPAQVHFDRSGLTIHLHASHPGLVLFGPDNTAQEFSEHGNGLVAIFPGAKFIAATQGAHGFLTPHGVRATQTKDDRYALVAFIHTEALESDVNFWRGAQPCLKEIVTRLAL